MKKLVRDKIPEIIKSEWMTCEYHIASDFEYSIELFKKIVEEATEVQESKSSNELIEELADIIEVLHSICKNNWLSIDDIEKVRLDKLNKKWWFNDKIILTKY